MPGGSDDGLFNLHESVSCRIDQNHQNVTNLVSNPIFYRTPSLAPAPGTRPQPIGLTRLGSVSQIDPK